MVSFDWLYDQNAGSRAISQIPVILGQICQIAIQGMGLQKGHGSVMEASWKKGFRLENFSTSVPGDRIEFLYL
ncbi:hypothetical protein I7I50_11276 [Histoplasma capsulatum G186AR]|uniref:Uncharacterized protein n=1 Tax=Ajellomyces capsulatus TaxID=5037 RepID=A0A8H7Z7M1_AJECA|nr:hypothetical protein I7I52_02514 [Histoplasma capsulatum]QSS69849.1 hypothetical protein I7I50_11276 [Histoplasma capsulatum G186AR]